ncbi:unnamed protein product [Ilex paraguariensis]|uniref:C2H2-type domain-containing protein n=1 Tax=Ilex paraguariensis TaxID=185542 RepID=A0ABC8TMN8_9AQUA
MEITGNPSSEQEWKIKGEVLQVNKTRKASFQNTMGLEKKNDPPMLLVNNDTDDPKKKNREAVQKMQKIGDFKKKRFKFWCEMCQIGAYSMKVMEAHRKGKKHVTQLLEAKKNDGADSTTQIGAPTQKGNEAEAANDGEEEVLETVDVAVGVKGEDHRAEAEVYGNQIERTD